MDYPNRRRIKIWGTAKVVEGDDELLNRLIDSDYVAKPERTFVFQVQALDVNCPQHIKPRWTEEEIAPAFAELRTRVKQLDRHSVIKSMTPSAPFLTELKSQRTTKPAADAPSWLRAQYPT